MWFKFLALLLWQPLVQYSFSWSFLLYYYLNEILRDYMDQPNSWQIEIYVLNVFWVWKTRCNRNGILNQEVGVRTGLAKELLPMSYLIVHLNILASSKLSWRSLISPKFREDYLETQAKIGTINEIYSGTSIVTISVSSLDEGLRHQASRKIKRYAWTLRIYWHSIGWPRSQSPN